VRPDDLDLRQSLGHLDEEYGLHMASRESWASSPRTRAVMRGNRSRDTRPELALRSVVHAMGLRYRVAARPLPNWRRTADMVFSRAQVAVFVDGCFWHGCPEHYVPSASNVGYWEDKVARNKERDRETDAFLREAHWIVIRCWAHEDMGEVAQTVADAVRARIADQTIRASPCR
jgi:DNA mismatch endonuclease, patch repair protein